MKQNLIQDVCKVYEDKNISGKELINVCLSQGFFASMPNAFFASVDYKENDQKICLVMYFKGNIKMCKMLMADQDFDIVEFQRSFDEKQRRYNFKRFVEVI